jgi:anti-sigma regulatory factor (Ser/Thr protein kinase)
MIAADPRLPVQPPYLLTAGADRPGTAVPVIADIGMVVVEVAPRGPWSPQLGHDVSAVVRMCLAGPPCSIIVNLDDLEDSGGVSASFWLGLWHELRLDAAPVGLVFCLPEPAALSLSLRHPNGPQPRVFATVSQARAAIAQGPSHAERMQARLQPRPASIRAARALVAQACQAWHLPDLLQDTWLIVSELAANAVEHACTDFVLTVSRGSAGLHVAIHDRVSRFPQPAGAKLAAPASVLDERGRGLRLVQMIAAAWGAVPTPDGKVVWATVK